MWICYIIATSERAISGQNDGGSIGHCERVGPSEITRKREVIQQIVPATVQERSFGATLSRSEPPEAVSELYPCAGICVSQSPKDRSMPY